MTFARSRGVRFAVGLALVLVSAAANGQTLPVVPEPAGNVGNAAKRVLGKILFHEEQLSDGETVACATCHRPEAGGGDPRTLEPSSRHPGADRVFGTPDDGRGSPSLVPCGTDFGFEDDGLFFPGRTVSARKAPGVVGAGWDPSTTWDGRASPEFRDASGQQVVLASGATLETQAAAVLVSREMGCAGRMSNAVVAKLANAAPLRLAVGLTPDILAALASASDYPALFAAAFGDAAITRERIAMAIAAYERSLVPDQTPYDAWLAGNASALSPAQVNGLVVLVSHYCVFCHPPPLFTDHGFHNVGVRPPGEDAGRAGVTGLSSDRGRFKTPSLRNVGLRAPYFHHGGTTTLEAVWQFYERGGDFADNRASVIAPFPLSTADRADAVDFMVHGLTDPRCAQRLPPFDRPTLRSELAPNPLVASLATAAATTGPVMIAPRPPFLSAPHFALGVAGGPPSAAALLAISPVASPGPIPGVAHPIGIALDPAPWLFPFVLSPSSATSAGGYATFVAPIEDIPALQGLLLHAQWAVADPSAALGFRVSPVASFSLFAP